MKATFNTIAGCDHQQDQGLSMVLMFFSCMESIAALGAFTTEPMVNAMGPRRVLLINRN